MTPAERSGDGFTDEDLKRLKDQLAGNAPTHGKNGGVDLDALLARLEAAEKVCVDVGYPDHPFLDEMPWRRPHFEAWRKSKGG